MAVRTRDGGSVDSRTVARLRRWAKGNVEDGTSAEVREAATSLLAALSDPPRPRTNGTSIRRVPVHRWPLNVLAGCVVLFAAVTLGTVRASRAPS